MESSKRKALEAAGWKFGDAADFLEMNEEERQLLETRVRLAISIRRQREASQLSQKELGKKLNTSQPRIAKIEQAAPDVSLDQLVRAFAAAGGKLVLRPTITKPGRKGKTGLRSTKSAGLARKTTAKP